MASSHQVEVLACLTEEEALHTVLQRLVNDIMKSGITTPEDTEYPGLHSYIILRISIVTGSPYLHNVVMYPLEL